VDNKTRDCAVYLKNAVNVFVVRTLTMNFRDVFMQMQILYRIQEKRTMVFQPGSRKHGNRRKERTRNQKENIVVRKKRL
jgi:hypothetical protein